MATGDVIRMAGMASHLLMNLQEHFLFASLPSSARKFCIDAMTNRSMLPGDVIINQGTFTFLPPLLPCDCRECNHWPKALPFAQGLSPLTGFLFTMQAPSETSSLSLRKGVWTC